MGSPFEAQSPACNNAAPSAGLFSTAASTYRQSRLNGRSLPVGIGVSSLTNHHYTRLEEEVPGMDP
jgi:hypothetical protein